MMSQRQAKSQRFLAAARAEAYRYCYLEPSSRQLGARVGSTERILALDAKAHVQPRF